MLELEAASLLYEMFSFQLRFVQQREVTQGSAYPDQQSVLHEGPHLHLVKLHEAISVKQMPYSKQEDNPDGCPVCHTL